MEKIAIAYLERGDVVSALPILGTLAMGANGTNVQRLRRLQHARLYREATAVLACLGDVEGLHALGSESTSSSLTDADKAAVCDAVLDDMLPSAVFFSDAGDSAEATRRLHKLRLAVHPDKCKAPNAAAAVARLHSRKEAYDATVAERRALAGTAATAAAPTPGTNSNRASRTHPAPSASPDFSTVASPSLSTSGSPRFRSNAESSGDHALGRDSPDMGRHPRAANTKELSSTAPSLRSTPSFAAAFNPANSTPTHRAQTLAQQCSRVQKSTPPRSQGERYGSDPDADRLRGLISSFRTANAHVKLQSDLSFEACAPTPDQVDHDASSPQLPSSSSLKQSHSNAAAEGANDSGEPLLSNNVHAEFTRLREVLLSQLQSACGSQTETVGFKCTEACEVVVASALDRSSQNPNSTHTTVVRHFVVPASGFLPVLSPKSSAAGKCRHGGA